VTPPRPWARGRTNRGSGKYSTAVLYKRPSPRYDDAADRPPRQATELPARFWRSFGWGLGRTSRGGQPPGRGKADLAGGTGARPASRRLTTCEVAPNWALGGRGPVPGALVSEGERSSRTLFRQAIEGGLRAEPRVRPSRPARAAPPSLYGEWLRREAAVASTAREGSYAPPHGRFTQFGMEGVVRRGGGPGWSSRRPVRQRAGKRDRRDARDDPDLAGKPRSPASRPIGATNPKKSRRSCSSAPSHLSTITYAKAFPQARSEVPVTQLEQHLCGDCVR